VGSTPAAFFVPETEAPEAPEAWAPERLGTRSAGSGAQDLRTDIPYASRSSTPGIQLMPSTPQPAFLMAFCTVL
jgi:hypothetical protein